MSWYIGNEERAAHEAAAGAHRAPSSHPETPAARAEREWREDQERRKQAATDAVNAQRAADKQAVAEARQQSRAVERAALEERLRVMFFKNDAATDADWLAVKDELVRDELVRGTQQRVDDDRSEQRANIAGIL